jgi:hypothetical protein
MADLIDSIDLTGWVDKATCKMSAFRAWLGSSGSSGQQNYMIPRLVQLLTEAGVKVSVALF